MRISETISSLRAAGARTADLGESPFQELEDFGSNPGNLRAFYHVPAGVSGPAPLVVVLHGCTQSAASYDAGSGWSKLADRHGFVLLFPEQQRANNPNLCFNWFQDADTARGSGEAESIRQMIARIGAEHAVDPSRIFVTGLSAGGAMAGVMLAAYPEVFEGGAIIAGIAYGCAGSVGQAFECMGGRTRTSAPRLGDAVRAASPHRGPWPRVSVWHGSADQTVNSSNGDAIVSQWLNVHGLPAAPSRAKDVEGYPHRIWAGSDGRALVEQYVVTGMGHGTPIAPGEEAGQSGVAGPHMLDAAISSTDRIAEFFGIADAAKPARAQAVRREKAPAAKVVSLEASAPGARPEGVQQVIEDALRKAGLMP